MHAISTMDGTHSRTVGPSASPAVLVANAEISMRRLLERLIQASGWHAETLATARALLARPRSLAPTCLVLDVALPDLNGLEVQKRIATDRPEMAVVFITGCGDVATSVRAMKAGAREFLTNPVENDVVVRTVRQALDHSRRTVERMTRIASLRENYDSLTPREREVMTLVTSGLLNKQVGGELGISEITVKQHRGQVMRKMRANSLPALVNMAGSLGLASRFAEEPFWSVSS
jgi:FixJ family two-component response regulator